MRIPCITDERQSRRAATSVDILKAGRRAASGDLISCVSEVERQGYCLAQDERVVSISARCDRISCVIDDPVVAAIAKQLVSACPAIDRVVSRAHVEDVDVRIPCCDHPIRHVHGVYVLEPCHDIAAGNLIGCVGKVNRQRRCPRTKHQDVGSGSAIGHQIRCIIVDVIRT